MGNSEKLPVAVIGLGSFGQQTLQALQASQQVEVVGLADRDPSVVEPLAGGLGIEPYTDIRSMLSQTRPKAVFLSTPPTANVELIATCAQRGIHVCKDAPLARNLTEGASMVRRMDDAGLKFVLGTPRRFMDSYRRAWESRRAIGHTFLARANYLFNWGPVVGWRGDVISAGGGALLELGYHFIDLLVWMLALPEEVYGITAVGAHRQAVATNSHYQPSNSNTDDAAAAVLRFAQGCIGSVVASRASGPVSEQLSLHGLAGSLTADSQTCLLRDPDGRMLDESSRMAGPLDCLRRQVDAFAGAVLEDAQTYQCSARENLLNMAVVEAIYLSQRTCQAESPAKILKPCGMTINDCLARTPLPEAADEPLPTDEPAVD